MPNRSCYPANPSDGSPTAIHLPRCRWAQPHARLMISVILTKFLANTPEAIIIVQNLLDELRLIYPGEEGGRTR
jgi:hypothetical protein